MQDQDQDSQDKTNIYSSLGLATLRLKTKTDSFLQNQDQELSAKTIKSLGLAETLR